MQDCILLWLPISSHPDESDRNLLYLTISGLKNSAGKNFLPIIKSWYLNISHCVQIVPLHRQGFFHFWYHQKSFGQTDTSWWPDSTSISYGGSADGRILESSWGWCVVKRAHTGFKYSQGCLLTGPYSLWDLLEVYKHWSFIFMMKGSISSRAAMS